MASAQVTGGTAGRLPRGRREPARFQPTRSSSRPGSSCSSPSTTAASSAPSRSLFEHRQLRRRPGRAAGRRREAHHRHHREGAADPAALDRPRHRAGERRRGPRQGRAHRGPPHRPGRRGEGPGRDRLALPEEGLLLREGEGQRGRSLARRGADHLRHHRGQPRRHRPGRRRRQRGLSRRQRRRGGHGLQARRLLVVPEGRVQRGQGRPGHPRSPAQVVRRPGLHRFPGRGRLAGLRQRPGEGHPQAHRGRGRPVPRGDVRGRRQPALLDGGDLDASSPSASR